MSFTNFHFWFLFQIIFIVYWAIPARCCRLRNLFLLIVSYLLYMNWKPAFAVVLLTVTVICFVGGGICLIYLNKAGAEKYSRLVASDIKDLLNSGRHKDLDSID